MTATPMTASPAASSAGRLHTLIGRKVTVMTLRDRYTGTLRAVHRSAVWIELRDDCLVAITDEVVSATDAIG